MEESKRIFLFTRFTGQMLVLLCLLAGTVPVGQAQSTATLQGTVSDPNGNPIAGARVVARNQGTGVASETAADNAGQYLFATLPIGVYRVEYSQPGFETVGVHGPETGRRDDRHEECAAEDWNDYDDSRGPGGIASRGCNHKQHGASDQREDGAGNTAER